MRIFFPPLKLLKPDLARILVDCEFCKILHLLLPNYLPGSVSHLKNNKSREFAQQNWKSIVSTYSWMKLTKPSDRLPVIAGIAKSFSAYLDDRYLCGIWSNIFHQDLTWQVNDPLSVACRNRASFTSHSEQSPSWSWAPVNAPVTLLATKVVRQLDKRQTVDFMLIVVDRGENTYARTGIAHTNIRQTSRYYTGSIFEEYEPRTIKLA